MALMTTKQSCPQQEAVPEWVAKVRAIAIDTNAVGKGTFDLAQLHRLAHQAKQHNGLEVWIAEPVMWEWAEHLREDRVRLNEARAKLAAAGIELCAQPADIDDALSFVRESIQTLGQHVKILPIGPVAVEAMMDQILVRSPGERITRDGRAVKNSNGKSVKTGAADSAIYRVYRHQAGDKIDTYVVLSGDSDVHKAHKTWGIDAVKVIQGIKALDQDIFRAMPAPASLVTNCASYLRDHLDRIDLASFESLSSLIDWELEETMLSFAATGTKVLVGLSDAKLDKKSQLVTAEAWVVTDLIGPEVTTDMYGERYEDSATQRPYQGSAVRVGVTFTVEDGVATSVSMGSVIFTSVAETVEDVFEDDGPLIVLENLAAVPGLEDFDWAESFFEPKEINYIVDGDELQLDFSGSAAHEWTLTTSYRGKQVDISGTPRYDGMDWGDGNVIGGTVWLSTDSELVANYPSLAVNALIMNTPKPT